MTRPLIDREEIDIPTNARRGVCGMGPGFFDSIDRNGDGIATPRELQQHIVKPTIVYSERMRIELGGKVVELVHPGLNHSDDATVMLFPAERALFATEFLADALVADNARAAERLRPIRRQPARRMDQVVRGRRSARLRPARDRPRRPPL